MLFYNNTNFVYIVLTIGLAGNAQQFDNGCELPIN